MGKAISKSSKKIEYKPSVNIEKHIDVLILGKRGDNYQIFINEYLSSLKVITINELLESVFWESNIIENMNKIIDYIKNSEIILYDPYIPFINTTECHMLMGIIFNLKKPIYSIHDVNTFSSDYKAYSDNVYDSILKHLSHNVTMQSEIERKWLISEELYNKLIIGSDKFKWNHIYDIIQFFDYFGVRYRQQKIRNTDDGIWNKNIKSKTYDPISRTEIECDISLKEWVSKYREFKRMGKYQRPIKKIRYTKKDGNIEFELNKIKLGTHSIHMIEIEYPNKDIASKIGLREYLTNKKFSPDYIDCNIYECTNNPNINNKTFMNLDTDRINGGKNYENFCLYKNKINNLCPNSITKNPKGVKIFNEK